MNINISNITALICLFVITSCNSTARLDDTKASIEFWQTNADESLKLEKQSNFTFDSQNHNLQTIEVDPIQKFQSIDGFGYTLTGGSVEVINRLSNQQRRDLLEELFANAENAIGISYIRLSIGASDLNSKVFSYNDLPTGKTDVNLSEFSLEKDRAVIEMLKEILAINPNIKIIATPWSPPVWMKDNGSTIGGSLRPEYYDVYARYFVKYIQEMKKEGIVIDAITPQNEPLHSGNNPSMYMTAEQERDFIKYNLGPNFEKNNIKTKIVTYDHNCDKPEYPMTILADPEAAKYVDGSAFHLYAGNISALSTVKNAYPTKNLYFTEQWTGAKGTFAGDLIWHTQNVIIGSMRNWSKVALEWNLANDTEFKPFTPGGCTECKGAITIDSPDSYKRNVAYYIIAHASKFVPQDSQRIASTEQGSLNTVAFLTPEGKVALIVVNGGGKKEDFNIKYNGKIASTSLPSKSVATYIF